MTEQTVNNKWFSAKEQEDVKIFKPHGRRAISFRQAHGDSQDVAVAKTESFEEHNQEMKMFSRSHRLETQPYEANRCGDTEDLAVLNAPRFEKEAAGDTYSAVKNRRLHFVPGCRLPRHRLSLN